MVVILATPLLYGQSCYRDSDNNYLIISDFKDYAAGYFSEFGGFFGELISNKNDKHFFLDKSSFSFRFYEDEKIYLALKLKRKADLERYECTQVDKDFFDAVYNKRL